MADKPRSNEYEDKVFTDKNGIKYQGQRFIPQPQFNDIEDDRSYPCIEIWYLDGKLHGSPAIVYPDGLEEEWTDGKFEKILQLPFHLCKN
jgi:hypothetical protein